MASLEVSPARGKKDTWFTFTITDAPIVEITKPPYAYGPDNHLILYVESPGNLQVQTMVITRDIKKANTTMKINPQKEAEAHDVEVPKPVIPGWDRWFCALYRPDDFATNGDVLGTPLATCVFILNH